MTELVSWAGEKAVLLLSLPLLILLRSSQMLCLCEINGFLTSFSVSWGCSCLPESSHPGPWEKQLPGNSKTGEAVELSSRTPTILILAKFKPSFTIWSALLLPSPRLRTVITARQIYDHSNVPRLLQERNAVTGTEDVPRTSALPRPHRQLGVSLWHLHIDLWCLHRQLPFQCLLGICSKYACAKHVRPVLVMHAHLPQMLWAMLVSVP